MAKKLGRGMNALLKRETTSIANNKEQKDKEVAEQSMLQVDIHLIQENKNQPRHYFDEEKIAELAQSIKNQGILQPLLVVKRDLGYFLVAGERRLRAAKHIKMTRVPVIVISLNEEEIFEAALVENLQRENLNPIETALSFKNLLRIKNTTHLELAKHIGVSRSVITNALRLLSLPQNIQEALEKNTISYSHARELLSLPNETMQQEAFKSIVEKGLSVHSFNTEKNTYDEKEKKLPKEKVVLKKSIGDQDFLEYQNTLIEHFGTNVKLSGSFENGSIKIEFYNQEDFSRIIELLNLNKN